VHAIEARALWVHIDLDTGAPAPVPPDLAALDVPRVTSRLSHPAPPPADAARHEWIVRATDIDVMHHVNNAAYWAPAEELLAERGCPKVGQAEIEFRAGVDEGERVELVVDDRSDGFACWWCVGGSVRASILVACSP
jgi:acyl-ACP thioesterase